jgi:FkbM family methyltransferase
MITQLKTLYGRIFRELSKVNKRVCYNNLILKIPFVRSSRSFFNFALWLYRIKFRINLKEGYIYKKDLKVYYSYIKRNLNFINGIDSRFDQLLKAYLLKEIDFKEDDYVIDCGANIGEVSLALNHFFGVQNFVVFEPEDREFNILKKNLSHLNTSFHNIALFNKKGTIKFYQKNESGDSSVFETENSSVVELVCDTLTNVINDHNIPNVKLLKLEAEGAEPEILEGALDILHKIEYISVDGGPERGMEQSKTLTEVSNILFKNNFDLVNINNQKRDILLFKNKG